MYQPPASGNGSTIWVPLQNYQWSAGFNITWTGTQWMYNGYPNTDITYSASVTDSPPTWSIVNTAPNYSP